MSTYLYQVLCKCPTSITSFNSPGNSLRRFWFCLFPSAQMRNVMLLSCQDARAVKQWRQLNFKQTKSRAKLLNTNTSSLDSEIQEWLELPTLEWMKKLYKLIKIKDFLETKQKLELRPSVSIPHCLSNINSWHQLIRWLFGTQLRKTEMDRSYSISFSTLGIR